MAAYRRSMAIKSTFAIKIFTEHGPLRLGSGYQSHPRHAISVYGEDMWISCPIVMWDVDARRDNYLNYNKCVLLLEYYR
jgi:hypothetical protein